MASSYELWLTDDSGRRITLLKGMSFFSYSRAVKGFSTIEVGLPYRAFKQQVFPVFEPDRRIEVWRSPKTGIPLRLEGVYLLRKPAIYTRVEDGINMIVFYGRGLRDLLARRVVIQAAGTSYTRKEMEIDDMMKEIVSEQMLYGYALDPDGAVSLSRGWPEAEFFVQAKQGLGPVIAHSFADRNVLDTLKDLQSASFQLHDLSIANEKIYFDIATYTTGNSGYIQEEATEDAILDELGNPILAETRNMNALRFETYAGLYKNGQDRTTGVVFSVENNNLKEPYFSENHLQERNSVIVKGFGRGDSREWVIVDGDGVHSSRWNRCEIFKDASNEPDQDLLEDFGYATLHENRPEETMEAVFLNVPPSADTPSSLYGIDWDLGDLLPVFYADRQFNSEVTIVYVAVNDKGRETITGRSEPDASN